MVEDGCGDGVALKSEAYIPTRDEWWQLYIRWSDKLASSLWRYGSQEECQNAVLDIFMKFMGVHPKFKLLEPLEPKTEGQWYARIWHQTRGRLSNMHKHEDKSQGFSTSDEDEIGIFGMSDYDMDSVCRKDLRAAIRAVIRKTCREQGFSEKAIAGFFASKISCLNGKEVVQKLNGTTNENALYVCNKRVMDRLVSVAKDPSSELYALWAA